MCACASVCGRLGIGCGRTCETGMQSDSCVVLMQPQAERGAKANKLDKCILCIQGTPVTHTHTPLPPLYAPLSLLLVFYDTLLCACGRASYKNSCTFCLYASRMLLLPPVKTERQQPAQTASLLLALSFSFLLSLSLWATLSWAIT